MNRNEAKQNLIDYGLTAVEAEEVITAAETSNCEPTSRCQPSHDTTIEFAAHATLDGVRGVSVYYYPDEDEFIGVDGEPIDDLGRIDWQIAKYETW